MAGVQSLKTWEWWQGFNLRTHTYPLWLSLPGFLLKWLGLDTNFMIINSIYFMHCIIWVVGDYYVFLFVRQVFDKKTACFTIIYSMTSEYVNDYVLRTSANGIEANLMIMAFYYFINIKPKVFNRELNLLTFAITVSFIIRSSSLVGYIPLAFIVIYQDSRFFVPILVAGFTIAIPMLLFNIFIDAQWYGFWTFPQWNFVYWNVIEGISKHFGIEPFWFYFDKLNNEFCEIESYGF